MPANLQPDTDLAAQLFDQLRTATADGLGVTRDAYGPGERKAHEIVRAAADALGLESRADHAGNLLMTLPGSDRSAKRIVMGSHLDSVKEGGNFDGAAGVLAGMAVLGGMARAGFVPTRDITVIAIRAEEAGQWFPTSYPGSHAALGTLPASALDIARQDTGRSLADHMTAEGFDPAAVRAGTKSVSAADTAAYLELHIEQGPVLDAEAVTVGIVTGIPGSRRYRTGRVVGEYNHSGATPRRYRRDAGIALAELAAGLDDAWGELEQRGHQMVCTFCVLGTTAEAGFTKIPGEALFQLDMRAVDPASLEALDAVLHRLAAQIEARRNVHIQLGPVSGSKPSPMDAEIQAGLLRAAEAAGVRHISMASGGGHDAAAFAQAGIPAGMLFVRNQNGSHNPYEAMRREDFDAACDVMLRWAMETAG
jgi:N-carbamoyl-L-amino-acid hydrolase